MRSSRRGASSARKASSTAACCATSCPATKARAATQGCLRGSIRCTHLRDLPPSRAPRRDLHRGRRAGAGLLRCRLPRRRKTTMKLPRILVAAFAALALPVAAQQWPTKPVKIIVPFAPGGPADIYARAVGEKLQSALGQPFVIEDKPGGGSIVGTDQVAKSAPDGYTLLMMSNTHTVNESLVPNRPFELMRDFVPIAPLNYAHLVLVVNPSVRATNLKELIALAKSKPGELNYAA